MFKLFSKKSVYFPGCLASSVLPEIVENYIKILRSLKIDFFMLNDLNCCGAVARDNGYSDDFNSLKERNLDLFHGRNVRHIITNCGNCMQTLALQHGIRTQHVSQVLVGHVNKLPVKHEGEITIYDSPNLMVYEEPRRILDSLGFDVVELERNKGNTVLCGAEGGMIQNIPTLANKIVKKIFEVCKTDKLIVCDALSYYHLKKNAPRNIDVLELSEVIV